MRTAPDGLPDETLLAGLGAGDADLALAFVRRFQRIVFGVAMTVIRDPAAAEDVAQQTFEQAWRHAQVYDSRRGAVRAWLTTIAHNLAVDVLRSRAAAPVDPDDLPAVLTAVTQTPNGSRSPTTGPLGCAASSAGCQRRKLGPWRWLASTV
jgi:DNA-directed RNA polymerase specialized sigma24 family protein